MTERRKCCAGEYRSAAQLSPCAVCFESEVAELTTAVRHARVT